LSTASGRALADISYLGKTVTQQTSPNFNLGVKILHDPVRNKRTAFTDAEREANSSKHRSALSEQSKSCPRYQKSKARSCTGLFFARCQRIRYPLYAQKQMFE
jgi:hypothetical protein